jgi:polar amino acid transport system substrate-binding protein
MRGPLARAVAGGLVVLALSACASIPRDPDDTLQRVQENGVLRVGASASGDLVTYEGDAAAGREADLVTGFAETLGVQVEWTLVGETAAVAAMQRGELDVLIGGLHHDSPWSDKVSLTRPYAESTEAGETVKHVLAVPLGENAMLVRLETYLDEATS